MQKGIKLPIERRGAREVFSPTGEYLDWRELQEETPPIGEYVLTYCGGKGYPDVHTNKLEFGSAGLKQDPSLVYWSASDDFDEVTQWAPMPPLPDVLTKEEAP